MKGVVSVTKKRVNSYLTEDSYRFLLKEKERTGENISEIMDRLILQHQMKSEDFMEQLSEMIFERLKPSLVQLRTIGNETNVVARTNKELLNYILLADNYIKEFETNGNEKDHLVTIKAQDKVRSQVNHQRLISLENKRLKNEKKKQEGVK